MCGSRDVLVVLCPTIMVGGVRVTSNVEDSLLHV